MNNTKLNVLNALVLTALAASLAGCGESDLAETHQELLNDAIDTREASGLGLGAAQPDTTASPLPSIDLSQYNLVFNDEFDGDSLDVLKWDTALWSSDTVIYEQQQFYVDSLNGQNTLDSPFVFDGSSLKIQAVSTPDEQRAQANEQPFLSGLLTTRNTFNVQFGYLEASVKLEEGAGIWPSFWMLGSASDGLNPEVYIFEYDGSKPDSLFHNYNYVDAEGNLRSPGQQEVAVSDLTSGFHTVGLQWSPVELLFYINGSPSYRIVGENVPTENMYLILNLAMGGIWPGPTDSGTPDPASFEIDYVRVYQLSE